MPAKPCLARCAAAADPTALVGLVELEICLRLCTGRGLGEAARSGPHGPVIGRRSPAHWAGDSTGLRRLPLVQLAGRACRGTRCPPPQANRLRALVRQLVPDAG